MDVFTAWQLPLVRNSNCGGCEHDPHAACGAHLQVGIDTANFFPVMGTDMMSGCCYALPAPQRAVKKRPDAHQSSHHAV